MMEIAAVVLMWFDGRRRRRRWRVDVSQTDQTASTDGVYFGCVIQLKLVARQRQQQQQKRDGAGGGWTFSFESRRALNYK